MASELSEFALLGRRSRFVGAEDPHPRRARPAVGPRILSVEFIFDPMARPQGAELAAGHNRAVKEDVCPPCDGGNEAAVLVDEQFFDGAEGHELVNLS